ncbi:MAG: NADH-quinone oxidoreductase subunit L [Deltaproteobacteria bacterium]|nr:MAG: NADH-quinone oxidoreductase subunit L [Deltaproteobacteria bacterium]
MKTHLLLWIVALPLVGAACNGIPLLFGKRFKQTHAGWLTTSLLAASLVLSGVLFVQLQVMPAALPKLHQTLGPWIHVGSFRVDAALLLDPLSALLLVILFGLGLLAHIHAIGSMKFDPSGQRFFSLSSLLMGMMALLLLSDNFVLFLLGWQAVGVLTALLVGFWFQDAPKAEATVNTYVFQRIGDVGLWLGVLLLFWTLYPELQAGESLSFAVIDKYLRVLRNTHLLGLPIAEVLSTCLLLAAVSRCAQFPLHVWLGDTQRSPAVAAALLQTMAGVAGGAYLLARMNVLFSVSPTASWMLASLGAFTALFAAGVALFQNDIRTLLAYSTISQVGFMLLGFGVGAYAAGIFHLMTHSCVKMLLILGAGNIIAHLHHEHDIRRMGGLLQLSPWTGFPFLIGTFALIGFPGFSGFFSQHQILWKTFATHHTSLWVVGSAAAMLTAFYGVRMFCLAFLGSPRVPTQEPSKPNLLTTESNKATTAPLVLLAAGAGLLGLTGLPFFLTNRHPLVEGWLAPLFVQGWSYHPHGAELMGAVHRHTHLPFGEFLGMGIGVMTMVLGAGAALSIYAGRTQAINAIAMELSWEKPEAGGVLGGWYRWLYQRARLQQWYQSYIVQPLYKLSHHGLWPFDQIVLDGLFRSLGYVTLWCSQTLHKLKSRKATWPLFLLVASSLWLLFWFLLRKLHH